MFLLDRISSDAREDVNTLLVWIGAVKPATEDTAQQICIYHLERILAELRLLIPYIEALADSVDVELPNLETAPRAIDNLDAEIRRLPPKTVSSHDIRPDQEGGRLMQGKIGDFPIYSLLPYLPKDSAHIEHFRTYKAALLLIAGSLNSYAAKTAKDYSSALSSAANALRLSVDKPLLAALPPLLKTGMEDGHAELERLRNGEGYAANTTEEGYLRALETLFRYFRKKTGGHIRGSRSTEQNTNIDTSEKHAGRRIRIVRPLVGSQQTVREAKKSGLAPSELAGDDEYIIDDIEEEDEDEPPPAPPQTLARQAMAAKRRLDAIERNAQLVPNSTNRLVPWEHAIFLRFLKDTIKADACAATTLRLEATAALAVSFWLSKKLGDAFHLAIYADESRLPVTSGFLGYLQSTSEWVIPALRPKGEPKHADVDLSSAIDVGTALRLPDIVGASAYLSRLPSWDRARRNGSASAFDSSGSTLEDECKEFLKQAKALSYNRITRARIADALFLTVFDECGDKALASLTLGRPHRLSDTQLHYTEVPSSRLRDQYLSACRTISEQAIAELKEFEKDPIRPTRLDETPEPAPGSIGCRIRPTDASIARVAQELANAVDAARLEPLSDHFLVDFTNLYTTYVVFQLQHLTGIRAVKNPIPSAAHIDLSNRLLIACDKGDYTAFNTRVIPLGDVITTQLRHYLAHRRAILSRLDMVIPKAVEKLRNERPKPGLFFLLQKDGDKLKVVPAHPSEIYATVRRYSPWFGLPENCQRARLRSHLLDRRCPSQWIDAMMGHWTRGEEPWHRFATTALYRLCNGLRVHLDAIATADGWRALRGLG